MNRYLLLFDIDGTLLRLYPSVAAPIFAHAIKQVLNINISLHPSLSFAGRTDYGILLEILNHNKFSGANLKEKIIEIYDIIYQNFQKLLTNETITILPGVRELLELLNNDNRFTLALLTGNFEKNAYLKIGYFNLQDYFKFGVYGDFIANRNELPLQALELANSKKYNYNFLPEQCLVIGDTASDIESAKQAQMHSLAVATGVLSKDELAKYLPDLLFENFADYQNVYSSILDLFNIK
ncbi:MAG TPA: HAD family hydrolase [Bacteroidota bacterium]|nr:HAD family hydrolase [Candidatus Kapabacteria bacterium]HRS01290.1 HAD family hydrolase [Bacteroidota bacterium]